MPAEITRLSKESQASLVGYIQTILSIQHTINTEMYNRLAEIDYQYFMYKNKTKSESEAGKDVVHGETRAGDVILDEFTIPIVISQVDTFVGYLAEVYLSGYPLFPVVTTPEHQKEGEKLEAIIDTHATIGGYGRQLLKSFYNGVKYNFMPLVLDWERLPHYNVATNIIKPTEGPKIESADYYYNCLKSVDAYNTIWDHRVSPADVAAKGEYAGWTEVISRIELKRVISQYNRERISYNQTQAFKTGAAGFAANNFQERPTINDFTTVKQKATTTVNWLDWIKNRQESKISDYSGIYERSVIFARIIPSEHGIRSPQPNTPQIWKLDYVHPGYLIGAKRVITFLDLLPVMIGQPLEDDFGLQTYSIAERGITFQEASSKLLNIRFEGARRAVADRALYDPNMIRPSDVNAPVAAAKIPVNVATGKKLSDAYEQQPYNDRSTEGVVQDAIRVAEFAQLVNGSNKATQGQFVKGNKTRKEWDDIMGFSDNRFRLGAIMVEHQVFMGLKNQIRMNIFQYGSQGIFQNYRTGETYRITADDLAKIKENIMSFKTADGFTPTSKIIPTELITAGMQLIGSSPQLQQSYGAYLPRMFSHMMSLGGVPNLDQYAPEISQQQAGAANVIQQPSGDTEQ